MVEGITNYQNFVGFLAARITEQHRQKPGRLTVNVSGGTNAGKSTLARNVAAALREAGQAVVEFSEDYALQSWQQIDEWRRGNDPKFENPWEHWFRWTVVETLLREFRDPAVTAWHCAGLYNKGDEGRLTLIREDSLTDRTILVYDGVFTFDPARYPAGFDFSVFLRVDFETAIRRSVAKGRSEATVRENYRRCFIPPQLAYREQCRPEEKANLVVDLNDFEHPQVLVYRS